MELQQGDIFANKGKGILGWAVRNLISPSTDRFHYGILWRKLPDGDFIILESIMKGVAIGKLSWYKDVDTEFYRVDCPESLRMQAPLRLIDWGRSLYDYLLIPKIVIGGILMFLAILLVERKIRRLKPKNFPYAKNNSLICTEAVDVAYSTVGVNIVPMGTLPLPNSFKQAEIDGLLVRLDVDWATQPNKVVSGGIY